MALEKVRLRYKQDYDTPFDNACSGFNQKWWNHDTLISTPFNSPKGDCWSFLANGNEVARALISDETINGDNYEGLQGIIAVKDICFFEVRRQYRRMGFGSEAAALLVHYYQDQAISAFPIDETADSFWSAVGFTYYPRKDQTDIRDSLPQYYNPLFLFRIK